MRRPVSFIALLSLLTLVACSAEQQGQTSSSAGKLTVAASFYPLAYFAQSIGGDLVTVTQITPGGVEPHDYEPSLEQLVTVQKAEVFLMNGAGIDPWGDKVIGDLTADGIVTVRMTDGIGTMGGFGEGASPSSGSGAMQKDPHLWLSPVLAIREVSLIRDALSKANPAHAKTYATNAAAFQKTLNELDAAYRTGLSRCALHTIVTSHNAFRYLAKEYGFSSIAIAGLDPEEEPSAQRIAELADFAKQNGVKHIFFETLVSPKLAETVAGEIGAQALVLNPIEGLTAEDEAKGDTYLTVMRQNLENLRIAMQCQ